MRARLGYVLAVGLLSCVTAAASPAVSKAPDIRGAWNPETYFLKDGSELKVGGFIFFTESDWTVLFFVVDKEGTAQRGSGEGGTYTLDGEDLVFTHLYDLTAGKKVASLPAVEPQYVVRDPSAAPTENCRVEFDGDGMVIHFPSGNRISFRRSSRF